MYLEEMNFLLSGLVILAQIFALGMIVHFLFCRSCENKAAKFVFERALALAFAVALTATLGSLYYSEIAKFAPCDLCWFQRIFMYPQVVLLGLALWKKENHIIDYSLALIFIGTLISLYHNYIYYTAQQSSFCSITSCTQRYVAGFGFVTIPLMALTGFFVIGLLLLYKKLKA